MRTCASILAVTCIFGAFSSYGQGTVLFSGSGDPRDQGWTLNSGAGHLGGTVTVTPQNSGTSGDVLSVQTSGMQFHSYSYDTGYSEFLMSARIRVDSASYNFADAGLGLMSSSTDRLNGFYIAPEQVGFMDLGSMAPVTPNAFHNYSVLIRDGSLSLFIDYTDEQILGGTAIAALTRTAPVNGTGIILFGDQTNDDGVNSMYQIGEVRFQGFTLVPEPSTMALCIVGSALLAFRRRVSKVQI